jgi:hypothetical protein
MSSRGNGGQSDAVSPPSLKVEGGQVNTASLADVIQWFLDYDRRAAIIRHPKVEELFHWKQAEARAAGENIYQFDHAEDRLAVGIMQALSEHDTERELHGWISQLLNALDDATKTNEEMASAYRLETDQANSTVKEAEKIPTGSGRRVYLTCCWLEALCTAELRIMGWIYQELYGRPYAP